MKTNNLTLSIIKTLIKNRQELIWTLRQWVHIFKSFPTTHNHNHHDKSNVIYMYIYKIRSLKEVEITHNPWSHANHLESLLQSWQPSTFSPSAHLQLFRASQMLFQSSLFVSAHLKDPHGRRLAGLLDPFLFCTPWSL